jgi:hypothetical protein
VSVCKAFISVLLSAKFHVQFLVDSTGGYSKLPLVRVRHRKASLCGAKATTRHIMDFSALDAENPQYPLDVDRGGEAALRDDEHGGDF